MTEKSRQCGPQDYACMSVAVGDRLIPGVLVRETGQPVFADLYVEGMRPTYRQTANRGNAGVLSAPIYVPETRGGPIPAEATHWIGRISYRYDEERAVIAAQHHNLPAYVIEDMAAAGLGMEPIPEGLASAPITADQARWLTANYPPEQPPE